MIIFDKGHYFYKIELKSNIPNEIKVIPELRPIFENEFSLIGKRGRTIKQLRI